MVRRIKQPKRFKKASCTVYALTDLEGRVRYIGQTRSTLKTRFAFHKKDAAKPTSPVHKWMASGLCADILVIEEGAIWNYSEALWIRAYRKAGAHLLNVSNEYETLYHALSKDYQIRLKISCLKPTV